MADIKCCKKASLSDDDDERVGGHYCLSLPLLGASTSQHSGKEQHHAVRGVG